MKCRELPPEARIPKPADVFLRRRVWVIGGDEVVCCIVLHICCISQGVRGRPGRWSSPSCGDDRLPDRASRDARGGGSDAPRSSARLRANKWSTETPALSRDVARSERVQASRTYGSVGRTLLSLSLGEFAGVIHRTHCGNIAGIRSLGSSLPHRTITRAKQRSVISTACTDQRWWSCDGIDSHRRMSANFAPIHRSRSPRAPRRRGDVTTE